MAFPFAILEVVSIFIFIAITAMYFSSLPPLGKAACILMFVLRIGTGLLNFFAVWDALLIVITVLYASAKGTSSHGLSKLDYAFIVLSIVGHAGTIIATLFFKYTVRPHLYREWLDSYQIENKETGETNSETNPAWETGRKRSTVGRRMVSFFLGQNSS
jgi:hypothetical protein